MRLRKLQIVATPGVAAYYSTANPIIPVDSYTTRENICDEGDQE